MSIHDIIVTIIIITIRRSAKIRRYSGRHGNASGGQWPSDIDIFGFSDYDCELNQTYIWMYYKSVSCDKPKPSSTPTFIYTYIQFDYIDFVAKYPHTHTHTQTWYIYLHFKISSFIYIYTYEYVPGIRSLHMYLYYIYK